LADCGCTLASREERQPCRWWAPLLLSMQSSSRPLPEADCCFARIAEARKGAGSRPRRCFFVGSGGEWDAVRR
jgi:hypothetical protein